MNYVGISCGFHDAGLSVVDKEGKILFAGHSERYSMQKHDKDLCVGIIQNALGYITEDFELHYYEKPLIKAIRQFQAKQSLGPLSAKEVIGKHNMDAFGKASVTTHRHHLCHAATGFQTSPYTNATVVIIDAIGELDTITIWNASYDKSGKAIYKKLWGKRYPDSIGLFYSAMTQYVGLRPLDEEYILMGMSAYGKSNYVDKLEQLIHDKHNIGFKQNLHIGLEPGYLDNANDMDVAASTQTITETLIDTVMSKARALGNSTNLVFGGGVALNCLANRNLGKYFKNMWIVPNPGDAGNSLGAAALGYGRKLQWTNSFLGYDIKGDYPIDNIIKKLYSDKIVGVASGRAEFGPRALGNRSLLADPRGPDIKDKVNAIKRRQQFRPFAPVIMEEHLSHYFDMPINWHNSRYMQVVANCRYPDLFPAIVHIDNTSRVQSVPKDGSGIRRLLERWYSETGCPMLLNTSLNVRGEPMVNNRDDADRFERLYNIAVCS